MSKTFVDIGFSLDGFQSASGIRLFDGHDKTKFDFKMIKTVPSSAATHITYSVTKH